MYKCVCVREINSKSVGVRERERERKKKKTKKKNESNLQLMRLTDPLLQSYPPRSDDSCQNTVVSGATKKGTTVPPIIFRAGEHHPSFS